MSDLTDFHRQADRLQHWCKTALKGWHETACDPRGGFAEFRRPDGSPDFDHKRRVRVQFRLAYVYALAAHLGWYDNAKIASDHAWDFATSAGFAGADHISGGADKGCAHMVAGDGSLLDPFRDSYAQAFIILAGAWRYRAFDSESALSTAQATLGFLNTHLLSPYGGWEEGLPLPKTPRRQNPHMHLFEAMLALYEATQNPAYIKEARSIHRLFEAHFFDKSSGAVLEFFEHDWAPYEDGGPIEPGHMMEWAWLLSEYSRLSGTAQSDNIAALYQGGMELGFNAKTAFLVDSCDFNGDPVSGTFRSWPQTELVKASVSIALSGDHNVIPNITRTIERMFETYFATETSGGWHDKLDAEGQIIDGPMQSSTFYHIICMAAEVERLQQALNAAA